MQQAQHFLQQILQPCLQQIGVQDKQICWLLLATAIIESEFGQQMDAQRHGLYQIHGNSHRHLWDHFLILHPQLASDVRGLASQHAFLKHPHLELDSNLAYSSAICYCLYLEKGLVAGQLSQQGLLWHWAKYFRHSQSPSLSLAEQRLTRLWPESFAPAWSLPSNCAQISA